MEMDVCLGKGEQRHQGLVTRDGIIRGESNKSAIVGGDWKEDYHVRSVVKEGKDIQQRCDQVGGDGLNEKVVKTA